MAEVYDFQKEKEEREKRQAGVAIEIGGDQLMRLAEALGMPTDRPGVFKEADIRELLLSEELDPGIRSTAIALVNLLGQNSESANGGQGSVELRAVRSEDPIERILEIERETHALEATLGYADITSEDFDEMSTELSELYRERDSLYLDLDEEARTRLIDLREARKG